MQGEIEVNESNILIWIFGARRVRKKRVDMAKNHHFFASFDLQLQTKWAMLNID
ncbi:hypothetical protein [Helicobacter sp. T3_23-1059]